MISPDGVLSDAGGSDSFQLCSFSISSLDWELAQNIFRDKRTPSINNKIAPNAPRLNPVLTVIAMGGEGQEQFQTIWKNFRLLLSSG